MSSPEILNPEDFEGLKMSQLVAWFNENCADHERVKSFRTIAMGVTRCKVLMKRIDAQIAFEEETAHLTDEEFQALMMKELSENAAKESVSDALKAGTMPGDGLMRELSDKPAREKAFSNSEGVSLSWTFDDVRKKRVTRNHVTVTYEGKTQEFGSVRKAFAAYGLPDSKHIRFRGKLKKSGHEVFEYNGENFIFDLI